MGTKSENKSISPAELEPLHEMEPDQKALEALDARDIIEPAKQNQDHTGDHQQHSETETSEMMEVVEQEISLDEAAEITFDEVDREIDQDPGKVESEVSLDEMDVPTSDTIDSDDPTEPESEETAVLLNEEPDRIPAEDEMVSDEIPLDGAADTESKSSEIENQPTADSQDLLTANKNENESVALDDDGSHEKITMEQTLVADPEQSEDLEEIQSDMTRSEDKEVAELSEVDSDKKSSKTSAERQNQKISALSTSPAKKMVIAAAFILMIAGGIFYGIFTLLGNSGKAETVPDAKSLTKEPAAPIQHQAAKAKPPGKYDKYLAKLEEADQLRNDLLQKKEEIYKLKLHYRNGIVELIDQIDREIRETNVSSFEQALQNKRIELNLRTIQRRQAYIEELEQPDQWVHKGSEELLFLKRKTLLDIQIADIASGIDLNRHLRYVNAAIQKYQPSAEKLAVDDYTSHFTPLETIWSQIKHQKIKKVHTGVNPKDEKIIADICAGNFMRIAELSAMTAKAARCLSQMNGSNLFLNGLKRLTPEEAKYISQWSGNWICLNGVNKLSPAVAQYLFKWEGNWISLNGLDEFPPELALYLMEWKGNQLELMGLNYHKKKPDPKALKYLALWETMGGKLFVSEGVRKEMERVM
ncbi:MAG: hypothetical protein PVH85_27495 [Desulfobacterales bacterium]|jgi:hypothetical protein